MAKIVEQIKPLIEPTLTELGYTLYDIEYVKEGKPWYLRIYIDKPGGVTLEDCVSASEHVSEVIDETADSIIKGAYYLEVSSPGAERPLKTAADVEAAIGKWVYASFYQSIDGEKDIQGRLLEANDDYYVIEKKVKTRRQSVEIPKSQVSLIRLAIEL